MKTAEELADVALVVLLDKKGFENFWYDLEDDTQEEILEQLSEAIQSGLDE